MSAITIKVPNWLDKICAWPVVRYRKWKYGYPYRRIYLGEGEWTILDQEDYYRFGHMKWNLEGKRNKFYAVCNIKISPGQTKTVRLHRLIMNAPVGVLVDHRNGETLDSRSANLRFATQSQNMQNRRKKKNTTSQYVGVCFDKQRGQWEVRLINQGKRIWIGRFHSEIEAARAHDRAALIYHKDFAKLNFPRTNYINEIIRSKENP